MRAAKYTADEDTNYLTYQQAVSYFNIGYSSVKKIAKECGAKVVIGGKFVRIKKDVMEDYFNSCIEKG